jgi:hypothetical protein
MLKIPEKIRVGSEPIFKVGYGSTQHFTESAVKHFFLFLSGMEGLVTLLRSPSCYSLQELRLNNTGCGVTGGRLLAKTLLECYHASAAVGHPLALRVFVLGRSRQENEGAKALGK